MMAGIRGKNTKPELVLRQALWSRGYRYRLHSKSLPGRPDIVLAKWHTAVQVQGCFWHGHTGCPYFRLPATRVGFWREKILANRRRDARNAVQLAQSGWRCLTVWECALREDPAGVILLVERFLQGTRRSGDIRSRCRLARMA